MPFIQKGDLPLDEFRQLVKRFLSAYELMPQNSEEQDILIEKVKDAYYETNDKDWTRAFARWFGDLLIGGGVKLYGIDFVICLTM